MIGLISCLGMQTPAAFAVGGDIALVVRPDTPADDLSLGEVRDLMLGERQSWNGKLRVTLLVRVARCSRAVSERLSVAAINPQPGRWVSTTVIANGTNTLKNTNTQLRSAERNTALGINFHSPARK